MYKFKKGDVVTPSKNYPSMEMYVGQRYTIDEVHEGNSHTPEQMVTVAGIGTVYSWRFKPLKNKETK